MTAVSASSRSCWSVRTIFAEVDVTIVDAAAVQHGRRASPPLRESTFTPVCLTSFCSVSRSDSSGYANFCGARESARASRWDRIDEHELRLPIELRRQALNLRRIPIGDRAIRRRENVDGSARPACRQRAARESGPPAWWESSIGQKKRAGASQPPPGLSSASGPSGP